MLRSRGDRKNQKDLTKAAALGPSVLQEARITKTCQNLNRSKSRSPRSHGLALAVGFCYCLFSVLIGSLSISFTRLPPLYVKRKLFSHLRGLEKTQVLTQASLSNECPSTFDGRCHQTRFPSKTLLNPFENHYSPNMSQRARPPQISKPSGSPADVGSRLWTRFAPKR